MKKEQILIDEIMTLQVKIDNGVKDLVSGQYSESARHFIQEDIDWNTAKICEVKRIYFLLFGKKI